MAENQAIAALRPGSRVMISAGAAGIGRVMVESFTRAGARVEYCDIDEAAVADCRAAVPEAGGRVTDMADETAVDAWFEAALEALGGLDVLINNAGISGPTERLDAITSEEWRQTIDVNLNSMFYATRRAIPALKAAAADHGDAAIINLSSIAGRLGYALRTPYAASKWAVVGLTKSLAIELGPAGVRSNAIQPGLVAGDRAERVLQGRARAANRDVEEMRAEALTDLSLRRLVEAEDIANMALFLSSPQARNISGQAISVCADTARM